jgi:HK97 family phage major capsid protein
MGVRLEALRRQHTEIQDGINTIEAKAVTEGREKLTEAETADVDALCLRAEALKPELEAEGKRVDALAAGAAVLARHAPSAPALLRRSEQAPAAVKIPSAGEFLSLLLRAQKGDSEASELLTRAVPALQKTTDNTGLLPKEIVGPIISLADDSRPIFSSMTQRPMPDKGSQFSRPRITQRVTVAEQAAELDELATRKMTLVGADVTKRTFAGTLELSRQDLDWTDPSVLQIVIDDFAGYYGLVTETAAVVALEALASATSTYTATTIATIIASFTTAIQAAYTSAKRMPDTCWLALDSMLTLAGNVNATTNESALTLVKRTLSDAGMPMKFVVGPQLTAGKKIIGCSGLVEAYENKGGLLSAPDVQHLGTFISYYGYVAFYGLAAGFVTLA